jgi:hypothetical protein
VNELNLLALHQIASAVLYYWIEVLGHAKLAIVIVVLCRQPVPILGSIDDGRDRDSS